MNLGNTVHLIKEEEVVTFYHFICPCCRSRNDIGFNTERQENVVFNSTYRKCRECGKVTKILFEEKDKKSKPRRKRTFKYDEDN